MNKFYPMVVVVGGEPLASTEAIALGVGIQHKNVLALTRAHAGLLREFGEVAFEARLNKRGSATEYAMLNERQTTLLLTLMRNSAKVTEFKVALIREFYRMRDALQQRSQNLWQQLHAAIAQEVESKVRASFGSHLMLERKKEKPHLQGRIDALESEIQPMLPLH